MDWQRYSVRVRGGEEECFLPFFHELIGCAFASIRPHFLGGIAVESKADRTPVTAADRETERAMRARIAARFPGHGIVGEEFGSQDGGPYRWILDPIDGTKAFISNCFLFGTLIALERDDGTGFRPLLGCIAHAAAGVALIGHRDGTRLYSQDGRARPARVRAPRRLAQATVLTSTPPGSPEQGSLAETEAVTRAAALSRTWGDCFGYFAVATGGADAMLDPQLSYWDMAALIPVVEGAGGRITAWDGGDPLAQGSLIASSGPLHAEILERLSAAAPTRSAGAAR